MEMKDVLHLFVIATIGAIIASLIAEFAKHDPNAQGGIFDRSQHVLHWAFQNAYGDSPGQVLILPPTHSPAGGAAGSGSGSAHG